MLAMMDAPPGDDHHDHHPEGFGGVSNGQGP
jgi:hypothetical protein